MMQMTKHLQFAETDSAFIVNLKYENSNISAQIILPKSTSKQDFNAALSLQNLNPVFQSTRVHLQLPKFKINSEFKLKSILQKLNVTKIFERIDCTKSLGQVLAVEQVIQKTFVEVDEKGTEAAAVTGIIFERTSFVQEEEPVEVNCNRPFWFILKGKGGEVLFINSIVD
ncbi:Serpin_1 [Hexamita inflata]|uniref:Serpin 1 n=1 Tax=Hexamita inflata TaxID=28002 RepID=A0AA86QQ59_9EUKA|nr:Serpin 1 [Hexamita inflata]